MPTISGYHGRLMSGNNMHQRTIRVVCLTVYLRGELWGGGGGANNMKCKGPGVNFLIVLINNSSRKLLLFTFKIESFNSVADNNKMIQLHCISFDS